jgi:hypothetical protein
MTPAREKTTTSQLETLAQFYQAGQPAEISSETLSQLYDWFIDEFRQLPLDLQFSDYMRYADTSEMFLDMAQGYLWVWVSAEDYDSAVYFNLIHGSILREIHDYDRYQRGYEAAPKIVFL